MANTTSTKKVETKTVEVTNIDELQPVIEVAKEIRMEDKVTIRSIAPWYTSTPRVTSVGDIRIPPRGTMRVTREEAIALGQSRRKLICGLDGRGSHATWYIEDDFTREELDFENKQEGRLQSFLTVGIIKKMFEIPSIQQFKNKLEDLVATRAEGVMLLEVIRDSKINDYDKVRTCESHTKCRVPEKIVARR